MWTMTSGLIVGVVFFVVVFFGDALSLKNVLLTIEPKVVQRFNHSVLRCSYDLEGDALYSVKWYRGRYEFYRYTPSEYPSIKTFPFRGINIDGYNSNSTQVALRDIDFSISGNFSCEVTTDAPFSTGSDTKTMVVVQLPEHPPTISVEGEPLDYGDTLRANCSSSPSKPKATLTLTLNNLTVARSSASPSQKHPTWSDLPLLMVLSEAHFSDGRLVLQCVSEIGAIYREVAVLKLGSVRDPVPERVTFNSSYSDSASRTMLQILLIISMLLMLS
ncbi:unnamed protein product [Phaedon cochleariae]|uniref:Ig-like domain-containing protein n=1 Tax=Phaedon cochleariae TaxID=80249 RepID=A0A9P0DA41_PHACE|nr:unnamed protein product [Phaedon cochleariae]